MTTASPCRVGMVAMRRSASVPPTSMRARPSCGRRRSAMLRPARILKRETTARAMRPGSVWCRRSTPSTRMRTRTPVARRLDMDVGRREVDRGLQHAIDRVHDRSAARQVLQALEAVLGAALAVVLEQRGGRGSVGRLRWRDRPRSKNMLSSSKEATLQRCRLAQRHHHGADGFVARRVGHGQGDFLAVEKREDPGVAQKAAREAVEQLAPVFDLLRQDPRQIVEAGDRIGELARRSALPPPTGRDIGRARPPPRGRRPPSPPAPSADRAP